MFRKIIVLSTIFTIVLLNNLSAQAPKNFSIDKEKYMEELYKFFAESDANLAENLMAELSMIWDLGPIDPKKLEKNLKVANAAYQERMKKYGVESSFQYYPSTKKLTDSQMREIIIMSNKMLDKRMKAIPDFESYITAVISFMITDQPASSFNSWTNSCKKIVTETKRKFSAYISKCNDLFLFQSIHLTNTIDWKAPKANYVFDYDSLPKVVFEEFDLKCFAKGDSSIIEKTKGVYYPTQNVFYGFGGTIYWTRANIAKDVSYAELSDYKIDMRTPAFNTDSVVYYNSKYFSGPLIGHLEEKIIANAVGDRANYPKFRSYDKKVFLKDIFPDVDYEGGFSVKGNRFVGANADSSLSTVYINRNDTVFLKAGSRAFVVRDDRIQAAYSNMTMYLNKDSIFHPSVQFKFLSEKRELTLYRSEQGISASPYFNNYHQLDMYLEWLKWNLDEPKVQFSALIGSDVGKGYFESANYYEESKFVRLQGMESIHPLIKIRNFVNEMNGGFRDFGFDSFEKYMRLPTEQVQRMLIKLNNEGFLIYDITTGAIVVKERLFEYILAKSGKTDYDGIYVNSTVKNDNNAELSLLNYDLTIYGVGNVMLSDTQRVRVLPKDHKIVVHKNRDFSFTGIVEAGKFQYFASNCDFVYHEFKMKMPQIDSMRIVARKINMDDEGNRSLKISEDTGMPEWMMVRNVLENLEGELEIDHPYNKSGIKKDTFPEFPRFESYKKSYVFYDSKKIQKGAYDRDKFYFQVDPFVFDSLNTFNEMNMEFAGKLVSNIFPDFEEPLTLMDDHSLGFIRKAPPGGFPMYGDKAKFDNNIKLSSKGLQGDGVMNYLTSTTDSDEFTFFIDSVNAVTNTFVLDEVKKGATVEYPEAHSEGSYMHFEPYKDNYELFSREKPIMMYHDEVSLSGKLELTPQKLNGGGKMEFDKAILEANLFDYKNVEFRSDTADFRLKAQSEGQEENALAFKTNNVNAYINLEERMGEFLANDGASYVDFPVNQYICYMDKFKWFMDEAQLELSSSKASAKSGTEEAGGQVDLSGSEFISTHSGQDSLRFISPAANYDLKEYIISAHDVKFINVADAKVYPGDGEVVVEQKAKMKTLENAKIVANNTTKYHEIVNANVNITARKAYTAAGDYEYVDIAGNKQIIKMNDIGVDTIYQTVASGQIPMTDYFKLSPAFEYQGGVQLFANQKELNFKGATRLLHDCDVSKPWIAFDAPINPKEVMIPIDSTAMDMNKVIVVNGIMMKKDSTHVYSAFLSHRKFHSDYNVTPANGYLKYDFDRNVYMLSNKEKLMEASLPGNLVEFSPTDCEINTKGRLTLDNELGQLKMMAFGEGKHSMVNDEATFKTVMTLDFLLDDALWKDMTSNMAGNPNLTPMDMTQTYYQNALIEMAGKEQGDKLISQINLYGSMKKITDEIEHNIVFSELNLVWNQEERSYMSDGAIGIGSIGNTQINKYVKGHVQLHKKRGADVLNIYLEVDDNTWYFFTYSRGIMQVLSSSKSFNDAVLALKPDKRESKGEKGEMPYQYMPSTKRKMQNFVALFD